MSMKALKSKDFTVPDDYEPIDYLRILWAEGLEKLIVPEGYDSAEYLKKLSYEGLYRRYPSITDELRLRLDYELDAIKQTDLTSIFLLSYDLFDYLRTNDIEVSPGCVANGIDAAVAQKLFDRIAKAAAYAFNQSHAVACAIVTYRMAWLKYYFNFEYTEAVNEFKDYSEATM